MKKILLTSSVFVTLFISGLSFASAQYTPYYNVYQNAPTSNSYIYRQGCYIYQYDRYTQITSLIGSNCQAQQPTYTYPTYQQPTYQPNYTYPTYQQNYTYPSYNNYSPYQTYGYSHGTWYRGYSGNGLVGIINNTLSNYQDTNSCYYQNGYQVCY